MFEQLISTDRNENFARFEQPLGGDALFVSISLRLERELPCGPYLADREFAKLLGVTVKTLCNRRALKSNRYPVPFKIANCREAKHVRLEIVRWLANEEMMARSRTVHRCDD